ncbi:MAG: PHP domain-containing protein [Firmicutes bacterium]|jgi:predicted metal-dependent phosphoesterase TrpH|nr:PHP domain-containing protein [Bacillota bacterium]
MKADLHIHTTESDGTWRPSEIGSEAKAKSLEMIAITDHDTTAAIRRAQVDAPPGLEVIPGIEISTSVGQLDEVHILGYWIDPENSSLQNYIKTMRLHRISRAQRIVSRLNKQGILISFDDVLRHATRDIVSRSHIAAAMQRAGYVKTKHEAFEQWIGAGRPAYVPRPKMSPEEAIELIRASGGVPVLAHPGLLHDLSTVQRLAPLLEGLEVVHSAHTPEQTVLFQQLARELNLLPAGGSDCHGPGGKDALFLGEYTIPVSWVEALRERRPA